MLIKDNQEKNVKLATESVVNRLVTDTHCDNMLGDNSESSSITEFNVS